MSDRTEFLKLNTSITTGSNAEQIETDSEGNKKASIELRLPDSLSRKEGVKKIDLQASQMRISLSELPIAFIPVDPTLATLEYQNHQPITTKLWMGFWKPYVSDTKWISTLHYIPETVMENFTMFSLCSFLQIPLSFEPIDLKFIQRTGLIPIKRLDTLTYAIENLLREQIKTISVYGAEGGSGQQPYNNVSIDLSLNTDNVTLSITQVPSFTGSVTNMTSLQPIANGVFLYGTPGILAKNLTVYGKTMGSGFGYSASNGTTNVNITQTAASYFIAPTINSGTGTHYGCMLGYNIICNDYMKNLLNFLPWLSPIHTSSLSDSRYIPMVDGTTYSGVFYVLDSVAAKCTLTKDIGQYRRDWISTTTPTESVRAAGVSGTTATYRWENIPTILLSPVSSVVLLMDGIGVNPQILPINIRQRQGSSLTTTVPVVENYFPLTTTLRDLHDDLILRKENFANTALFSIPPSGITERTLRFRVGFVTKDGQLFDLYIPPTGVFTLQLTFCFHY